MYDNDRGYKLAITALVILGCVVLFYIGMGISKSKQRDMETLSRTYAEEYTYYMDGVEVTPIEPREIASIRKKYTYYVDTKEKKVILSYRGDGR